MKHSQRMPCPVCDTTGEVPDEEMSSGWRICGECMGHGWRDEPIEIHGEPKPDVEAVNL